MPRARDVVVVAFPGRCGAGGRPPKEGAAAPQRRLQRRADAPGVGRAATAGVRFGPILAPFQYVRGPIPPVRSEMGGRIDARVDRERVRDWGGSDVLPSGSGGRASSSSSSSSPTGGSVVSAPPSSLGSSSLYVSLGTFLSAVVFLRFGGKRRRQRSVGQTLHEIQHPLASIHRIGAPGPTDRSQDVVEQTSIDPVLGGRSRIAQPQFDHLTQ
mmetsp:Transcript_11430/g.33695  ORF Transcript_11430/g.33695 Transcript_11430/m.33695 type:complete len:213 (+) Transcript_11430:1244-1882(+)